MPSPDRNLRGSIDSLQTPTRLRSRQLRPQKRARDDNEEQAPTSKRRATPASNTKRLVSVQSEFVLNANGLPSSPFEVPTIR